MWFLIALLSPLLLGIVYFIDEYLLDELNFKPITLTLFSSIVGGILAILFSVFMLSGSIVYPPEQDLYLLLFAGTSLFVVVFLYFKALDLVEASAIAPLYLTSVIFSYLLGVVFLGELISIHKILGIILILSGALILTIKRIDVPLKDRVLSTIYMVVGSLFLAVDSTIFKIVVDPKEDFFWMGTFWEHVGYLTIGIIVTLFFILNKIFTGRSKDILVGVKGSGSLAHLFSSKTLVFANLTNETLSIGSNIIINFVVLLAPVALVFTVVDGFQPLIVIFYGFILSKLRPDIFIRNGKQIQRKLAAFGLMFIGTIFILF